MRIKYFFEKSNISGKFKAITIKISFLFFTFVIFQNPAFATGPYIFSPDGLEVTDLSTGLIWRRCSEGQTWGANTCSTTGTVLYTFDQALVQAQSQIGWRLPNVKEMASIVDSNFTNPQIDLTVFPGTPSNSYWTSSPYVGISNAAWLISFNNNNVGYGTRSSSYYIRLVR